MKLSGSTRVLGIFGDPVAHSLSPRMHNAALAAAGIDAIYVPFHVTPDNLAGAIQALRALSLWGVNLTVPHKEAVLPLLDRVTEQARLIGAVNTVTHEDGYLVGHNTDAPGFLHALGVDLGFVPAKKKILVLGAGGASRAALVALAQAGAATIVIANRTPARARLLCESFSAFFPGTDFACSSLDAGELCQFFAGVDLLVNTSAMGLKGESCAHLPWHCLPEAACVYDMVYARGKTSLQIEAEKRGHSTADGRGMLIAQGEAAFALWTGQESPSGVMADSILTE
ncbi:shikimate dehydrogenase [Desulfuromonas sp. AOP6]|uniref:shikimate dehydrogenase n=1 Tax=Desulfuromonas sp. AOP6 TaxID=1566351 RepID=UPI00128838AE|nr:shikimate dehydrogenase [Desulfuromonas sp. AOP6]BCA80221.1 shikimate dehydrogenase (NADP(+)) [Desulfuromonas sp. AOP6]